MLDEIWARKELIEGWLSDPGFEDEADALQKELAEIEESLGLRAEGDIIRTGDPLVDYWIARHYAGEMTPEDLEMTEADLEKKRGTRRRR